MILRKPRAAHRGQDARAGVHADVLPVAGEDGGRDYADNGSPSLAWQAMLRLVERVAPDYKN